MDNAKTSRREFCAHAITLVTVTSLIEGCGGKGSPTAPGGGGGGGGGNPQTLAVINASVSGNAVTVPINAASPLASVGSAAFVRASAGPGIFLVTRIAENSFNALTAICTHEQCEVTGFSSGRFVCPCHGSQYSANGAVQAGPATRALQTFPAVFTNSVLTITV